MCSNRAAYTTMCAYVKIVCKRFLVEMALLHVTDCKVIPSSFSVKDTDNPVSLLANGSQFLFLFLINSRKTVGAFSFFIVVCIHWDFSNSALV